MGILKDIAKDLGLIKYTKEEEATILYAKFIADKFRAAAEIFTKKKFGEKEKIIFRDCLKIIWKDGNIKAYKFWVNNPVLAKKFPDICNPEKRIEAGISVAYGGDELGECNHNAKREYTGMYIATGLLDQSENLEQFEQILKKIIATIYHECDHIYIFTTVTPESEELEDWFVYALEDSELRAKSKELAYIYFTAFPGEKFDYEKLKQYLEKTHSKDSLGMWMSILDKILQDPQNFKSQNKRYMDLVQNKILKDHPGRKITPEMCQEAFKKTIQYTNSFVEFLNQINK